jgi:hypothetical protein
VAGRAATSLRCGATTRRRDRRPGRTHGREADAAAGDAWLVPPGTSTPTASSNRSPRSRQPRRQPKFTGGMRLDQARPWSLVAPSSWAQWAQQTMFPPYSTTGQTPGNGKNGERTLSLANTSNCISCSPWTRPGGRDRPPLHGPRSRAAAIRELADRLTAELAEARRPWWRRLLL